MAGYPVGKHYSQALLVFWDLTIAFGFYFFIFASTNLFLFFPNGQPLSPRWRNVAWLGIGAALGAMMMEAVRPGAFGNLPINIDNPIGINPSLSAYVQLLSNITTLIAILCLLIAVLSLILRLRLAQGDEAQQVKWFIFAAAFIPIGFLFQAIAYINPDWARPALTISYLLVTISLFGLPIASAIAIFKYHLYGIDTLINRTLVYGALSVILALI